MMLRHRFFKTKCTTRVSRLVAPDIEKRPIITFTIITVFLLNVFYKNNEGCYGKAPLAVEILESWIKLKNELIEFSVWIRQQQ